MSGVYRVMMRRGSVKRLARAALSVWIAALSLAACASPAAGPGAGGGLTPIPTLVVTPAPWPTRTHIPTTTPLPPTATPSPTATPRRIDYAPMIAQIGTYVRTSGIGPQFDMSVGFVDVETGQRVDFDGQTRHFALSTFKGPLGAYYFWLVEQGLLEPDQADLDTLAPMMEKSDNESTSCLLRRVGGLAGFNDWLAGQGLSRENNFVAQWQNWACTDDGEVYLLPSDLRYIRGDTALGLPGEYTLMNCYPRRFECFEAFSPIDLAGLYAALYQGKVLNEQNTRQWLALMKKDDEDAALISDLNPADQARVTAYVKNGFSAKNAEYAVNFQHEAGIIVTPYGVYTLAVFSQGNPDWPGIEAVGMVGRIVYDYFAIAHGPGGS